ncbi:MAG: hypothetical protein U0869_16675 [Chloroflexota bacterium]
MKLRSTLGILGASLTLIALTAQPMAAFGGLRGTSIAEPAAVTPAAGGSFGAKLNTDAFPSNDYTGEQTCPDPSNPCLRVMNRAYNNGTAGAPKDGTISKIKVVNGEATSFRLYFVAVKNGGAKAKVMVKGPVVNVPAQPDSDTPMVIRTIDIPDVNVKAGWRIAVKAKSTSILRCDSGNGSYVFQPTPALGSGYATSVDTDSCAILVQAIYR